jgi:hypothetical protein
MTEEISAARIAPQPLVYLPDGFWSPRYDRSFYTVKSEGKQLIKEGRPPTPASVDGKENLPAYYFTFSVYRAHEKKNIQRRYSQFRWLYQELISNPPITTTAQDHNIRSPESPIRLPSAPLFQWQDEKFAQRRLEQLAHFLEDMLGRPGYANHPAVLAFLELN